jgi:hypothetical protein
MRYCEHPDCDDFGDMDEMVRMPTGEWYCVRHASLYDGGRPMRIHRSQGRSPHHDQS